MERTKPDVKPDLSPYLESKLVVKSIVRRMDTSLVCKEVIRHRKLAAPALFRGLRELASNPIPIDLPNGSYIVGPNGIVCDVDNRSVGNISVIKLSDMFESIRPHLDTYHDHVEDMMTQYGDNGGDMEHGVIYENITYVQHFNVIVDDGSLYIIGLDSDI